MWDAICIVWYPALNMVSGTEFSDTWHHDMWHVMNRVWFIENIFACRSEYVVCDVCVMYIKHEKWCWEMWWTTWYLRSIWQYMQYIFIRFYVGWCMMKLTDMPILKTYTICIRTHVDRYIHIHAHIQTDKQTYIHTHMCIHVHTRTYMHECMHACMHATCISYKYWCTT